MSLRYMGLSLRGKSGALLLFIGDGKAIYLEVDSSTLRVLRADLVRHFPERKSLSAPRREYRKLKERSKA